MPRAGKRAGKTKRMRRSGKTGAVHGKPKPPPRRNTAPNQKAARRARRREQSAPMVVE